MVKNYLIGLNWILVISFLIRIGLVLSPNPYTTFDERDYYNYGRGLSPDDIGRPFLILIFSQLSSSLTILRLIDLSFGIFSIFLAYKLGTKLFDKKTGNIFSLILAFNPLHIFLSSLFLTDVIFLTFLMGYLYLLFAKKFDQSLIPAILRSEER